MVHLPASMVACRSFTGKMFEGLATDKCRHEGILPGKQTHEGLGQTHTCSKFKRDDEQCKMMLSFKAFWRSFENGAPSAQSKRPRLPTALYLVLLAFCSRLRCSSRLRGCFPRLQLGTCTAHTHSGSCKILGNIWLKCASR